MHCDLGVEEVFSIDFEPLTARAAGWNGSIAGRKICVG